MHVHPIPGWLAMFPEPDCSSGPNRRSDKYPAHACPDVADHHWDRTAAVPLRALRCPAVSRGTQRKAPPLLLAADQDMLGGSADDGSSPRARLRYQLHTRSNRKDSSDSLGLYANYG